VSVGFASLIGQRQPSGMIISWCVAREVCCLSPPLKVPCLSVRGRRSQALGARSTLPCGALAGWGSGEQVVVLYGVVLR
jgi:hypothetical protein